MSNQQQLLPDYYKVLQVNPDATANQIKLAYKRRALDHHPDKNINDPHAQLRFQYVNDAFSILSDSRRRQSYDQQRKYSQLYNPLDMKTPNDYEPQSDADGVFGDVFEEDMKSIFDELLRAEGQGSEWHWFYATLGGLSGAGIGFILANIPGAVAGYAAGAYLGKIRDRKGKAVVYVFNDLPADKKMAVLKALIAKVFSATGGGGGGASGK